MPMREPTLGGVPAVPARAGALARGRDVVTDYLYDAARFLRHSGALRARSARTLESLVVIDTHRIEKGLASARPRPWFGEAVLPRLLANTRLLLDERPDSFAASAACEALRTYFAWHDAQTAGAPAWAVDLERESAALQTRLRAALGDGATVTYTRDELLKAAPADPLAFFASRHSIRWFDERPVAAEDIAAAVEAAQHSPSGWNRQAWRVHVFPRGAAADKVLACQGGNTGFGHTASHVLVVATDLRAFVFEHERNQVWVDGGMFAMSLVHAFHALGLGSCCLNWSVGRRPDRRLRTVIDLPSHESVVMLLVVGHLPETVATTCSRREPTLPIVHHTG
ncbi:nitroreductase family protein [Glycomyces tritici]|uniref:Nitroreductase family protein n=1 Tax=Glycomyces tritici TaxID=2665176 RepID=A0ABT7YN95_9ACTN|nr:nitroreductase family protein [Glycomyces tritici]MDN3240111.1 nitroreductase family protein [Glycomyces tritici]